MQVKLSPENYTRHWFPKNVIVYFKILPLSSWAGSHDLSRSWMLIPSKYHFYDITEAEEK